MNNERVDVLAALDNALEYAASADFDGAYEELQELKAARAAVAALIDAAHLVACLASLEWQEADGSRKGATNNSGERLYFVSPDLIYQLRETLSRIEGQP